MERLAGFGYNNLNQYYIFNNDNLNMEMYQIIRVTVYCNFDYCQTLSAAWIGEEATHPGARTVLYTALVQPLTGLYSFGPCLLNVIGNGN